MFEKGWGMRKGCWCMIERCCGMFKIGWGMFEECWALFEGGNGMMNG